MTLHPDIVRVDEDDVVAPTFGADIPGEAAGELYVIPTALRERFALALDHSLGGNHAALIAYCRLFALWLRQRSPEARLLALCRQTHAGYEEVRLVLNNEEKISALVVSRAFFHAHRDTIQHELLQEIMVDATAHVLGNPDLLDAVGDTFFGEAGWQRLKRELGEA